MGDDDPDRGASSMPESETTEPTVNEHGYPDSTPVAEMSAEHLAAYWKHHARKHEARANAAPDADELKRLRERDAALKQREDADLTDSQRAEQEKATAEEARATAERERDAARAELLRVRVAAERGLTPAQADRLRGTTREELEKDADDLKALFGGSGTTDNGGGSGARSGGARGPDVGDTKTTASGAERYRQRHGKN